MAIIQKQWSQKKNIVWICMLVLVVLVSFVVDKPVLMLYILAVIAADVTDFEKIKKCTVISNVICVFFVLSACASGLIPDVLYEHGEKIAHCLGYVYYSNLSAIVFFTSTMAMSRESRYAVSWLSILFWLVVNWLVYLVTTTRLTFFMFLFELILIILIKKIKLFKFKNNLFWRFAATILFPVVSAGYIGFCTVYDSKVSWMARLNDLLVCRLGQNQRGLRKFGISLIGNKIKMIGNTEIYEGTASASEYFYIDSGFVYAFLAYGIIVFTLLILAYTVICRYAVIKQNEMLFIWCVVVCIHAVINNVIIRVDINPLLLMIPAVIDEWKWRKRIRI
ncbi:MAG: hypothetical protein ACI4DV_01585 [Lachnospiraceae bacterium]